jgi:hypothetical protein
MNFVASLLMVTCILRRVIYLSQLAVPENALLRFFPFAISLCYSATWPAAGAAAQLLPCQAAAAAIFAAANEASLILLLWPHLPAAARQPYVVR